MRNTLLAFGLLLFLLPASVFAHETRMYEINGVSYEMVVGSLNEPVIVDDKTGVSVEIIRDGVPFIGAAEDIQVEMIAGDTKKTVNLSPVYGAEGQYKSNFIATVPTTLTYRVFGALEDTPFDFSYTCNQAGHPQGEEDTQRKDISDNVVQTLKRGAFGCPQPKESFGFPEEAPSVLASLKSIEKLNEELTETRDASTVPLAVSGLALLISLGLSVVVLKKNIKRD